MFLTFSCKATTTLHQTTFWMMTNSTSLWMHQAQIQQRTPKYLGRQLRNQLLIWQWHHLSYKHLKTLNQAIIFQSSNPKSRPKACLQIEARCLRRTCKTTWKQCLQRPRCLVVLRPQGKTLMPRVIISQRLISGQVSHLLLKRRSAKSDHHKAQGKSL